MDRLAGTGVPAQRVRDPSDGSNEDQVPIALCLVPPLKEGGQGECLRRRPLNGPRWVGSHGIPRRAMPDHLPSGVAHRNRRSAGRRQPLPGVDGGSAAILRIAAGRNAAPAATILDGQTLRICRRDRGRRSMTAASGKRTASCAWRSTRCDVRGSRTRHQWGGRAEVEPLSEAIQAAAGQSVDLAGIDQRYAPPAAAAAKTHGIGLDFIKLPATSAASPVVDWTIHCMTKAGPAVRRKRSPIRDT